MFRDFRIYLLRKKSRLQGRSTRWKKNWKIFARNKNFVIENSVHRTGSKISIGSLFTTNVRRPIRGSDFRLSPISRSNHPGFYRVITPSYLADIFSFFFFPLEERRHNQRSYPRRASRLSNRPIFFAICKHSRLLTWRFPLSLALFRTVGGKRSFRNTRLSPIRDLMIVQPWKALFSLPPRK